jgi:DNA (cytosine-5)-methyltransferase 1
VRVIELFAGAGGAALGLERAGFSHAALVEWDADACATLRAAGLGPVVQGDVRDLDAVAAVAGELCDLLWSSFPCQAFSTAGQMLGADDDRNGWPWTVDAIDRFRPTWFLGENVRGLLSFDYFDEVIMGQLRERFRFAGFWLLNAADVGVPQHRRRVFTWAGAEPLVPPTRTHGPGMFTEPWVSMGQVLQIDGPSKWLNRPAPSVTTADGQGVGSADSRDILQRAIGRRRLTVEECATLQGFPDEHPWQPSHSKASRYRQVGNAVPPALAEAVGRTVINAGRGQPC